MTNTKTRRRALLASVIALLICISMLIGSTFAWFTDTKTTESTVIQAGTVKVVLEYWDGDSWEDANGVELKFLKAKGFEHQTTLWEPGCTYELPKIRVRNEGNLTAQTLIKLNGVIGDEKLFDALEFSTKVTNVPASLLTGSQAATYTKFNNKTFDIIWNTPDGNIIFDWPLAPKGVVTPNSGNTDTSAEFTVSAHMREDAGNEYQGLKLDGVAIQVLATQGVYEFDSTTREYDINAAYPIVPADSAELNDAVAKAVDGQTILLAENTTYEVGVFALNGKSINIQGAAGTVLKPVRNPASDYGAITVMGADGATLTVTNVTIEGTVNNDGSRGVCFSGQQNVNSTLVVKESTFKNLTTGIFLGGVTNAEIDDCKFENCVAAIGGTESITGTLTVDGCEFVSNGENIGWAGQTGAKLVIKNSPTCASFVQYPAGTTVTVVNGNHTLEVK